MSNHATTQTRDAATGTALARALTLTYGLVVYAFFFGTFLYMIGFTANRWVPKGIDDGVVAPSAATAVAINIGLLGLFAIQHTIMARGAFKRWWTRFVPVPIERSTFVLFTSALLALMAWQWRPMPEVVWQLQGSAAIAAIWTTFALGWGLVLVATFLIDHFDLFGLRQTVLYAMARPYPEPQFTERALYRYVRHPLLLGFLIAFWSTPVMTQGHLLFAVVTTVYILLAIQIEERELISVHGDSYEDYRRRVSMLVPMPRGRGGR